MPLFSILVLAGIFVFFFFQTVVEQEREEKAALQEHNKLTEMQMRNQRVLRHGISTHLSTIFRYI